MLNFIAIDISGGPGGLQWEDCSRGLGAGPPAGSKGRAPGQGIRGAKPP